MTVVLFYVSKPMIEYGRNSSSILIWSTGLIR